MPAPNSGGADTDALPSPWFNDGDESFPRSNPPRRFAFKITALYLISGMIWIGLTDWIVHMTIHDKVTQETAEFAKGALFVVATAVSLYLLLQARQKREMSLTTRLHDAISASRDGLWRWDIRNDKIFATPGGDADLGWAAARSIRCMADWRDVVHPDDWQRIEGQLRDMFTQDVDAWRIQQRFRTADGGWHWMEIKGQVTAREADGSPAMLEGLYHSIDALKRAQEGAERTNNVLRVLIAAYDAAATNRTSAEALRALVTRIVETAHYPLAWVGEARNDANKRIVPVAWAGPASEFAATGEFRWDDSRYAAGPTGRCVKTRHPCFIGDTRHSKESAPWLGVLEKFGIRSGISIPIETSSGQIFVLHIASSIPDQFTADDTDSFEMISRALALIIDSADVAFLFTQSELARLEISDRLKKALDGAISALATVIEKRDPYTAGHQRRVAELAVAIGAELGLDADRLEGLRIGASVHDIGKIGVPTEILSKPGRLDEAEIALIKRHADIGYEIVKNVDFGWPIEKIVRQHHERWDGSGYPDGLRGPDISLEARIVAVADVVESMGTNRPYRPKIAWKSVLKEIKDGRGILYDPDVVDAAMKVLDGDTSAFGFSDA